MIVVMHSDPLEEKRRFQRAVWWALGVEALFFLMLGLSHLAYFRNKFDSTQFLDAEIVQLPPNAHLSAAQATNDEDEVYFNPHHRHPKVVKKEAPKKTEEQNQVNQGPNYGPTHGPIALYTPAPIIPSYLRNQNLSTSVVIEFLISAQGQLTPRLLDSSGSNELDSIALQTVSRWKFEPATNNNVPINSKTRLRILFEVH